MTDIDEIGLYANPGHDLDGAVAMLPQARLGHHPIDDIQVRHLLQIGYRAGRQVTEDDQRFERTDHRLGRWGLVCAGPVVGMLLTLLVTWAAA